MNIQTVAQNLKNTIAEQEAYQEELAIAAQTAEFSETIAIDAMVNIAKLNRILQDVEQCRPDWTEYLNPVTGEK